MSTENTPDWSKWHSKKNNFTKYSHITSRLVYGKQTKTPGKFSIVILTYKRAHGLKNALDSALSQDIDMPYAITVVDDSGYDEATDSLMKEYCAKYKNVIYYRHDENLGQYANWNRACELSPTEWFCLLHDDDSLAPNYLSEVTRVVNQDKRGELGLLGVYFWTKDERALSRVSIMKHAVTNALTSMFIALRRGAPIPITLEDNMKLIYVLSCCLMINRDKVLAIGGLDDTYFPSSDFVLSSKMNFYYSTAFLPKYLCYRGIGENESLNRATCEGSIICAYKHTDAMIATLKPSCAERVKKRRSSFAAVAAEIGVLGYNNIDYSPTKESLGMKPIYNTRVARLLIQLWSRATWGLLMFRGNKLRGNKDEYHAQYPVSK